MKFSKRIFVSMSKHSRMCLHFGDIMVDLFVFLVGITATEGLLQDQYIGCFSENSINTPQPAVVFANDNALTIEKCIGQCQGLSNTFAGLQNGTSCFCTNDHGDELSDASCNLTCSGNPLQYCGGTTYQALAYVVYTVCPVGKYGTLCEKVCHCKRQVTCDRVTGICPGGCQGNWSGPTCDTKNVSDQYIGCYRDNDESLLPNNRALNTSIFYNPNSENTNELCIESCARINASYAGTQYSIQCFCGENYDRFGRFNESICSYTCSGKTTEICGGPNANSVYSICPVGNFGEWCLQGCNCLDNRRCVYENGSCPFNQCQNGWTGDGCNKRDCTGNNGGCYTNETCSDINLRYAQLTMCRCSVGFQRNKPWSNCTDIDECSRHPSVCDSESEVCINTIGSFICNKTGRPLNACALERPTCLNSAGMYRCVSQPGGFMTCTDEEQVGRYSVGAVIGVGFGSAAGSALIVSLICIGIVLSRREQRKTQEMKSLDDVQSRSQGATEAKLENPDRYETLGGRKEEEEEHSYSTIGQND